MSIESAIKAIHAAGLSDNQSEQFLSNDHLRRIVEVVLSEQWEPIETAPKDEMVLILDKIGDQYVAHRQFGYWYAWVDWIHADLKIESAIAWRHLPPSPETKA